MKSSIKNVYVYRKTLTQMDKLKIGDLFSMEPTHELFVVIEPPKPIKGAPKGEYEVMACQMIPDPGFEGDQFGDENHIDERAASRKDH